MTLEHYFTDKDGRGILSTSGSSGEVNGAMYAKPHFLADGLLGFITRDKLTRSNLLENPHACYLFIEKGQGYQGVRVYLEKVEEIQDETLIASLARRTGKKSEESSSPRFLVSFKVKKVLELIGDREIFQ